MYTNAQVLLFCVQNLYIINRQNGLDQFKRVLTPPPLQGGGPKKFHIDHTSCWIAGPDPFLCLTKAP